ncbi:MAG: DUF4055 domain-containing protein [Lentisphaeria bacterium]|nr:DUF4055 domain-containing protein [Lentisphaeria bacterium]
MTIRKDHTAKSAERTAELTINQLATEEYFRMRSARELCQDVFDGEMSVKAKGETYVYRPLSKSKGEYMEQAWRSYLKRGKLPGYAAKTLEQMIGVMGAIPPEIVFAGKAERLEFLRETATPYRDGLEALANRVRENVLRTGQYCLLLEPDENEDRFHINEYRCFDFLRCVIGDDGEESFARCVFLDTSRTEYDTSIWREVYYPQITLLALDRMGNYYQAKFGRLGAAIAGKRDGNRVYEDPEQYTRSMEDIFSKLEQFNVLEPDQGKCDFLVYPNKYGKMLNRIPFVAVNSSNLSLTRLQNPPLLNLCVQCLHILEADCDHQNAIFMTTDPTAVFTGVNSEKNISTGSDSSLFLPQGATFGYAAAGSSGIPQQMENIQKMKEDALQMGVSLAGQDGAVNSSGVALSIVRNAQTAALRIINETAGKGIEQILRYAGKWLGMTDEECSEMIKFTPSNDFAEAKATVSECVSLMNSTLPMTEEEKRRYLERNGIVDPVPWEELKEKLEEEKAEKQAHGLESVAGAFGFGNDKDDEDLEDQQKDPQKETTGAE